MKKYALLLLSMVTAMAATASVTVKGRVIDAGDQQPLVGATIIVPEKALAEAGSSKRNVNALTDIDGNFTLTVPDGITSIDCRYVGYAPMTVELKGNLDHLVIPMTSASTELSEVVVTGYQKIEKRKLTAAIQTVTVNDNMLGSAMNIDQALAGQVAGLSSVTSTGAPGASPKIRIRGTASLNGTQEPL